MGNLLGGYSNSRKHCLVEFPHVQTRTEEEVISIRLQVKYNEDGTDCYLVPEERYPYDDAKQSCYIMSSMAARLKTNEKAIIMGVFLLFVQNEVQIPLELKIRDLFSVHTTILNKKNHPDNTGKLTIMMDAQQRGLQPPDKQMLYISTAEHDGALSYAGLENRILMPRSIPIPEPIKETNPFENDKGKQEEEDEDTSSDASREELLANTTPTAPVAEEDTYEMFTDEDEMIKFVLQNRDQFAPTTSDMYKAEFVEQDPTKDITHYHVSKEFLTRVREYFADAIFPCLHYTKFVDTRLDLTLTQEQRKQILSLHPKSNTSARIAPGVSLTLQFNYLVITTGGAMVTPKVIKHHY